MAGCKVCAAAARRYAATRGYEPPSLRDEEPTNMPTTPPVLLSVLILSILSIHVPFFSRLTPVLWCSA